MGTATKGRYCRTPHLNVMEPVNVPNKIFLQVTDAQYKNYIYHEGTTPTQAKFQIVTGVICIYILLLLQQFVKTSC